MQRYSDFFQTLHDETSPAGYLGRGTHYSVLRAVVFHDSVGRPLLEGQFADFAVIWDEDHDTRVMEPIVEIYRRGALSSFQMFGERKGLFTAILSNKAASAIDVIPFKPVFLRSVFDLDLSVRTTNCLKNENIHYIGELVRKTDAEVLRMPNMGRKALNEIREVLAQMGLHLGMEVPGWTPENIEKLEGDQKRIGFLETEINAICQTLNDPWSSAVLALGSGNNPIISDEDDKVSLYLKNLEMLWQLGMVTRQGQKVATWVPKLERRTARAEWPAIDADGSVPG
jgi:Bacterial RNA polymerase, alpha chain C terminal domain